MTKRPTRARSVPRVDPRGPAARTRHDHAQELAQDFLTSAGQRLARESRERHDVVVRFLVAVGVPPAVAEYDAEGIEHHVSRETLRAFREYLERRR